MIILQYILVIQGRLNNLNDYISSFGRKVIQDALVSAGVLINDGWKYITGFDDSFYIDADNPHIKIVIEEVEECRKETI